MANRLKKLADARYTPGTPYQPYVPGYCIQVPYTVPGYQTYSTEFVLDQDGNLVVLQTSSGFVPPSTRYRQVCFPTQPAIAAVAPTTTYTSVVGWNGGARSIEQLDGDGYFEFQIVDVPSAVVVGLSTGDTSTLPSEPTHAVYAHSTTLDIMESGVVVHTAPVAHDYDNVYRIQRVGLTVTYSGPGWSYESAAPASGARVLDAAIYTSGEYVDNPTLTTLEFSGTAAGSLAAMQGHGYEGADYAEAYGTLGAMTGEAGVTFQVTAAGSLAALMGVASEGAYNYGGGSLQPLSGDANGGYPQVSLIFGIGAFPSLVGASHGLTGEVGTVEATLGELGGWASEGPYAEASGSLLPLTGYADSGWSIPGETYSTDVLLVGDFMLAQDVQQGSIADTLEITDTFEDVITIEDAVYDALMLSDSLTVTQALEALINVTLLLGNDLSSLYPVAQDDQPGTAGRLVGGEPAQYAVNVLTNAFTNYSGFGFGSFATANQVLYGAKADGVYRVRQGDDNGTGVDAFVDFGSSTYGTTNVKTLEAVYLGVATDGQLYARLETGLDNRLYRVVQRGDMRRALTAKGVGGRVWNVSLEVIDATEFELDIVEIEVGVTSRRWTSR